MHRKSLKPLMIVRKSDDQDAAKSATRSRAISHLDLRDPRTRASMALECWQLTGDEHWLQCAWRDAEKGCLPWGDLCQRAVGVDVDPPHPEAHAYLGHSPQSSASGWRVKAELLEAPVTVGQDVVLKIKVELEGKKDVFAVTIKAPTLFDFTPYDAQVRPVIAAVVAEHQTMLRAMFARMDPEKA